MIPSTIERLAFPGENIKEIWLAGGCFWGTQAYLMNINGVAHTSVGYLNGHVERPTYQMVCTGATGFAEAVHVLYASDWLPLEKLLSLYYQAIDPTSVNRQGGDVGDQYRTGIYYADEADLDVINHSVDCLAASLKKPVAIEVRPLVNYFLAEEYHQDYLTKNPGGYCHVPRSLIEQAKKA